MLAPGATGAHEYIKLPRNNAPLSEIRAVSVWVYMEPPEGQDDGFPLKYFLDARNDGGGGCNAGFLFWRPWNGNAPLGRGGAGNEGVGNCGWRAGSGP